MLKSAAANNHSKRVTFQSLGLDRAMAEAEMMMVQNSTNARRASYNTPSAGRAISGRSGFSDLYILFYKSRKKSKNVTEIIEIRM
jgi:hypothetical protein